MCRLRNIAMRDYQESVTTGQTHRQTPDKVIPMCRYASQATQKFTETLIDRKTEKYWQRYNIVAAFRGMHVSPMKHSYVWLPRKCDYRTDTRTDRQMDRETDRRRTKWSLCAAMLCRWHKNHRFLTSEGITIFTVWFVALYHLIIFQSYIWWHIYMYVQAVEIGLT